MSTGYKSHCHYLPDVKYLHFRPGSCSRTSPALLSSGRSAWPGTVADVAAPPTGADPGADPGAGPGADPGAEVAVTTGVASLAVRDLLRGGRRHGKILARLPHAIITGPWDAPPSAPTAGSGECWAGGSRVLACGLDIRIVRWWDPSPVFGPLSRARLDHGSGVLARLYAAAEHAPGLAGQDGPGQLAACCASGDLAGAVEAAEHLVGLGPGLVPSGDSLVSGVLLALRLLGGAISGGTRAVWLANWLSASVTCDAAQRTTTLAASLLHCAAKGQAAAEVSAVLLGMAGQEPLEPAASRLLAAPQGVDLAWGLVAGCRAALLLSVS